MADKVYVNLIKGPAGEERTVKVSAKPSGSGRTMLSFWKVEPGGGNADLKYLSAARRASVKNVTAWIMGGKFKNTLTLPHVGGDKYKVKVSKDRAGSGAIATTELETWRKIFFTLHFMNRRCRRMFDLSKPNFVKAFEQGKIEVEEVARLACTRDEDYTPAADSRLVHLYAPSVLAHKPFHLRIVVVNDIFDWKGMRYTESLVNTRSWSRQSVQPLSHLGDWLVAATAQIQAAGALPAGALLNAAAYVSKRGDQTIKVKFPYFSDLGRAIRAGRTVKVVVRTRERDHYEGHSIGNFVCVRTKQPGKTARATQISVLQTFTHEVGHGLKQVVESEPLHNAGTGVATGSVEKHPHQHRDAYGGQGSHCYYNCVKRELPTKAIIPNAGQDLCTMYYADHPKVFSDGRFCPECVKRLKRVDLSESTMAHWNQD